MNTHNGLFHGTRYWTVALRRGLQMPEKMQKLESYDAWCSEWCLIDMITPRFCMARTAGGKYLGCVWLQRWEAIIICDIQQKCSPNVNSACDVGRPMAKTVSTNNTSE